MICGASSTIQTVILALSVWISVGFTLSPHLPTTRTFRSNIRTKVVSRSVDDSKINEEISAELKQVKTAREIPGKHKWLGGAVDEEGRIYGVPSNAQEVICLAPNPDDGEGQYEMHTIPLPASIAQGQFKWLRGIIWENYLIGIPAWSQAGVLWVDIGSYWEKKQMNGGVDQNEEGEARSRNENFATVLPLPEGALDSMVDDGVTSERWLWHGAALNHNKTAIYAIPSNAQQVLKIDLRTKTTTLLPIPATVTPLSQTNKWYGGILGDDNAIYGVPYAASGVLRIDANTDTVELIGEDMFGVMEYNWHGGIKHPSNGKIYCFPAHNSHVLAIDTGSSKNDAMSLEERLSLLEIHRAPYDKDEVTRYKWLGGSLGADGNIYGMPSDASTILRIDTESDTATTFGKVSEEKNKYQGGTLAADGFIYAIPSDANNILCIDSNEGIRNDEDNGKISFLDKDAPFTIGDITCSKNKRKDKWQGGFVGRDRAIYCIPENFNHIMKVTPKQGESSIQFL